MAKIGLVIFVLIIGILLGGILQEHVCDIAKQDLGTGTSFMKITCDFLSIPIELILLILALVGAIIFYIKTKD